MDSRHITHLGVKLIVDITSIVNNPDGSKSFSIKIYNNSSFFLVDLNPDTLKLVFGKNSTIEATNLHGLITNYFSNTKEIPHYYVKRIVKLKYGDNFAQKVQDSKKSPDPEVDKLVLNIVSDYQGQGYNFWIILEEQFNRGPSTIEVMKDVEFLRAMVRTSMKDNVGLKKDIRELELKLEDTNKRNDEQDKTFKEAMASVESENQKLVELINQNKKDQTDLKKSIEYTRKELEVVTVDVSILLSSISALKDKIQFLLQVLQKKRNEVNEEPPKPQPTTQQTPETSQPATQPVSQEAKSTPESPTTTQNPEDPEDTYQPTEDEIAELDFPETPQERKPDAETGLTDGQEPVIPETTATEQPSTTTTTTIESTSVNQLSNENDGVNVSVDSFAEFSTGPIGEGSPATGIGEAYSTTDPTIAEVESTPPVEEAPVSSEPSQVVIDEEIQKLMNEEEEEKRRQREEAERRRKEEEKAEKERQRVQAKEDEEKRKVEEEIRKKRENEEKRRKELDEKRKRIERERQSRLQELKKKREKEREERKQRLLIKKREVLKSIRSKPLVEGGPSGEGVGGEGSGAGDPVKRRFVPNRGESKFSRSRKNNLAAVLEKGLVLGKTGGPGGFGNASLNKVVARGEHEWKLRYNCPERTSEKASYVGIYDPTKVKFEKIAPVYVGSEDIEKSYGLNLWNGKLYHLGQEVKQILPETGLKDMDILHVCVNLSEGTLKFKVNGEAVGSKIEGIKGPLSPACSISNQNEKVSVVNE